MSKRNCLETRYYVSSFILLLSELEFSALTKFIMVFATNLFIALLENCRVMQQTMTTNAAMVLPSFSLTSKPFEKLLDGARFIHDSWIARLKDPK